ncbi:uncharacterized protein BO87DRAFT_92418 [Aspergillus neoniger CBS 115656]|uniref:Uncharacterized protein n=1 Tax=Aspergillus neoniger (strain CBS 115656) TaxID=1448310 RepID=A0A318YKZ3_ASPNB|nr:hypothetical protein BO87DRAFT_92418 [Aspergillus neoniger CBS 115656]PYH33070.1 hypothetical protein BO87DRAFT_92418 [Aspergillus neoniger CBS 115656]
MGRLGLDHSLFFKCSSRWCVALPPSTVITVSLLENELSFLADWFDEITFIAFSVPIFLPTLIFVVVVFLSSFTTMSSRKGSTRLLCGRFKLLTNVVLAQESTRLE